MLIEYLFESGEHEAAHSVTDLDVVYKKSKQRFDSDPIFAEKARARVVALQQGDAKTLSIWTHLVKESLHYFQKIMHGEKYSVVHVKPVGNILTLPMLQRHLEHMV